MSARRIELEIVADTREFHRGLAAARRAIYRLSPYPGGGWSTPQFDRMVARIRSFFGAAA